MTSHHAVVAILAALRHRARTREGQRIDVSMQEVNVAVIGDAVLEYELTGRIRPRMGNRHPGIAPHGIYTAAGEDRWLTIAAEDEAQWAALCEVAQHPEWRDDPRFAMNAARKQHEDDLDAAITAWSATLDRDGLARRLARAGVAAAPVLEPGELSGDAGMRERGVIVDVTHPEAGRWPHIAVPWQFSRTPARADRPAPLHGEHSAEVFARLLGTTAEEYETLVAKNVTGMGPPS
jgi:crotonobetainyl-CoA:carnitine CoA-transferase CaiB-like acyl-CoA transferase